MILEQYKRELNRVSQAVDKDMKQHSHLTHLPVGTSISCRRKLLDSTSSRAVNPTLKSGETGISETPNDPRKGLCPGQSIHQNTNSVSLLIHGILLDPSCIPTSQLPLQSTVGIRPLCYWAFDSVDGEEITKDAYCCECSEDLILVYYPNM
jgi:hypothetical protein